MANKKASTKKSPTKVTKKTTTVVRSSTVATSSSRTNAMMSDKFANMPVAALFAEAIGTFILTAVVVSTSAQPIYILFTLTAIVLTIGHLSGSYVNPALTFGAWVTRRLSTLRAVGYIIAEVFGAVLALWVLNLLLGGTPDQQNPYTGQMQSATLFKATQLVHGKEWFAFFASMLGTGIFGFAVASALREKKQHIAQAFTVGGGLFIGLIVAGSTSILNPAVALGLQAFTGLKGDNALTWALAVHVAAPLIGAAIGFLLYSLLRRDVDAVVEE